MDSVSEYLMIRERHLREIAAIAPPQLVKRARVAATSPDTEWLRESVIHSGQAEELVLKIKPDSVALSVWSPPYFVGKAYEAHLDFKGWQKLLRTVIKHHFRVLKPGGFLAINIADILCFQDVSMPRVQAEVLSGRRSKITRDDVISMKAKYPNANRHKLAALLGCSEQTVDRRLNGNNIRGGKYETQTRLKVVGGLIEQWGLEAGLYPYDRRIWVKDPAWENSRWASSSYRAVDEFEYIYFLWKPGVTTVDRSRLSSDEWRDWGARAVWFFPSVRANDDHEAKFPLELPRRVIRLLSSPGDLVLDCFMGSGTTAIAAHQENRRFIGIERSQEYVDRATRSVSKMLPFSNADRPSEPRNGSAALGINRESFPPSRRSGNLRFS